jgi:hypothetical protein
MTTPCPRCFGSGRNVFNIDRYCKDCRGEGYIALTKRDEFLKWKDLFDKFTDEGGTNYPPQYS